MRLPQPVALALALTAAAVPRAALATPPAPAPAADPLADVPGEPDPLRAPPGNGYQWLGTLFFGDGLRLNNPYRLKTQLTGSSKAISLTAPYIDIGLGFTLGNALGLQHGASLNLTAALSGIGQAVLAPTYLATYRSRSSRFLGFGRVGPVIILSPDANVGGELGVGAAAFLTAKVGLTAELVGDLFYGAATPETGYSVYPIVSLQVGLLIDHEVLP